MHCGTFDYSLCILWYALGARTMKAIQDILKGFDPHDNKYVSRDFQAYGLELAEKLGDYKRRALYIKLAKKYPRAVLEEAYSFVSDAGADNKAALFMWKLKQMGVFEKKKKKPKVSQEHLMQS